MRRISQFALLSMVYLNCFSAQAADDYYSRQTSNTTQSLAKYVLNLGAYFGYDLAKSPSEQGVTVSVTLLDMPATQLVQLYLISTFIGAIPVNAFSEALAQLLPNSLPNAGKINNFSNFVFKSQKYNSPAPQSGSVSVSPLVDQPTFQQDPVSQSVLNILGTPDSSYCMNYDGSAWIDNCPFLFQYKVSVNAIGTLPNTRSFFSYDYLKQFISQLNSNSLTGPLLYSTENQSNNENQSTNTNNENPGLTAQSQAQQALNFIRYASGMLIPLDLPKMKDYDTIYTQASNTDGSVPFMKKMRAQGLLARYLAKVRTYAARSSVGLSNLYFILSKRLPQNPNQTNPMSQAMSEFTMATRRLFNPDMSDTKQWINQINDASPTTVQKEIATLLAEINYQLYLSRQQEERLLLTNSLLLLQNIQEVQPSTDFFSGVNP